MSQQNQNKNKNKNKNFKIEPLFLESLVEYQGQKVFWVSADLFIPESVWIKFTPLQQLQYMDRKMKNQVDLPQPDICDPFGNM